MHSKFLVRWAALAAFALPFCAVPHLRAQFAGAPSPSSAFSVPAAQLLQPAELARILQQKGSAQPLMFQIGSRVMFAQAHIPGSEYIGPGAQPAGLEQLKARVARLDHKSEIVLYCGCCPWNRCPNVGPAYKLLTDLGFTRVRVLYFANNFGADWAAKGYPVEGGR
jgi:thiosulfate/3-mercaptopyruvate sulfurtransferase